jgi:hypothetical protein
MGFNDFWVVSIHRAGYNDYIRAFDVPGFVSHRNLHPEFYEPTDNTRIRDI